MSSYSPLHYLKFLKLLLVIDPLKEVLVALLLQIFYQGTFKAFPYSLLHLHV